MRKITRPRKIIWGILIIAIIATYALRVHILRKPPLRDVHWNSFLYHDRKAPFSFVDVSALLVIEKADGEVVHVDARPSDTIAIALLKGADIFVASSVMEKAGKSEGEPDERTPEKPGPKMPPGAPEGELI